MVKRILAKGSDDCLDEGQMFAYINQLAGGETNHAKTASIKRFVARLALDALKTPHGVTVSASPANLLISLRTPTAKTALHSSCSR